MKTMKMMIEMEVPAGTDPSMLLAELQEFAITFAEANNEEEDDEGEPIEVDSESIADAVSVAVVA